MLHLPSSTVHTISNGLSHAAFVLKLFALMLTRRWMHLMRRCRCKLPNFPFNQLITELPHLKLVSL